MCVRVWVRWSLSIKAVAIGVILWPAASHAQIPAEFTNLRILSEDITRDSLMTVMRDLSFALNVRCQYCHVGGDGVSFEGVEFASDDDPDKQKARFMMTMVDELNRSILPQMPERDDPPVTIGCKTCHRGSPKPVLLKQELRMVLDEHGADSAAARYRDLKATVVEFGRYDFGEWEVNVLAERLEREDRPRDAIAIYELNAEYYPNSLSIALSLGQLYEEVGDTEAAIRAYERALEIRPDQLMAVDRLEELRGGG